MPHPSVHFLVALAAVGVVLALIAVVRNPGMRRRLSLSAFALVILNILHVAIVQLPDVPQLHDYGTSLEWLLGCFAVIGVLVTLVSNPWFEDRTGERAPAIVQDAIIAGLVVGASTFIFNNLNFLTGSAILAAVLGFAAQDTLGNAFAGLAIQIERPFKIGHWITVGDFEGQVTSVTWRATKIRTTSGNLIILPNNVIAKESINNYSEPVVPTRIFIEVGADYGVPPSEVQDACLQVMRHTTMPLKTPAPEVLLQDFGSSAITYRIRFWVDEFGKADRARSEVRTGIYYEFKRRNIEIPWPIQIEYSREAPVVDVPARQEDYAKRLAAVPVFAPLPPEAHRALAGTVIERLYGNGEAIVDEGDPGQSMFIVTRGSVRIVVGPELKEVAITKAGGYFGEMSLLTGAPRTATVIAVGDTTVLEIDGEAFGAYVRANPSVIDELARAAEARRRELDHTRATAGTSVHGEQVSLAQRMRRFFGLA